MLANVGTKSSAQREVDMAWLETFVHVMCCACLSYQRQEGLIRCCAGDMQYSVTIHWPASFIAKGYTSLSFGFETLDEAAQWHACVQQQLSQLRLKSSGGAKATAAHSPGQSYDEKVRCPAG